MYRSAILVCLLIGSTVSIRCWTGVERDGERNATDTDCTNQITCSQSYYRGKYHYGCGSEACEGLNAAVIGCRISGCEEDLCNGPKKCWVGYNQLEVGDTTDLVETRCTDTENNPLCSRGVVDRGDDVTEYTYQCGWVCVDDAEKCYTCIGRLCNANGALTTVPSLVILAIVMAWSMDDVI